MDNDLDHITVCHIRPFCHYKTIGYENLAKIRTNFRSVFNGLDIRFYKNHHEDHKGSQSSNEYDMTATINSINSELEVCELDLNPLKTVSELEEEFESVVGIPIQIFRKSKDLWLQTISTDHWTLAVQNRKGINSTLN